MPEARLRLGPCHELSSTGREGGQAGKRASFLTGNVLVAILGTWEPVAEPGPGAEREEWVGSLRLRRLGWRDSPAGGGPFPTGHRCSSVEGTNLLHRRALP
jgi:hypothetical protein